MLPRDYAERVYAGVLGKIIGVYLGRPIENWTYTRILGKLGEVTQYINDRVPTRPPLIVTDDDITGTLTFLRALPDYDNARDLTPAQIGQTWLNYLIERQTILWWGGMGNSTEHTVYVRLKNGITAPRSGSMELNGKVVAEQIGAQIFIDGWAMVAPGDPEFAADLARRAASVSHDGEAIYAAQVIAAMEAQAFVESDIDKLFDVARAFIPRNSVIAQLIGDVREWRAQDNDWHATRAHIEEKYGYDKFGGNCHVIPNHALIVMALAYAPNDFQRALTIVNTAGWDTDCNSANVGCLLGIKNGLRGIDASAFDFRAPVADRLYLPTADGGRCISDAAQETIRIVNIGRALQNEKPIAPKNGARFHFELPGSIQGFHSDDARIENIAHRLAVHFDQSARVSTPTFTPPDAFEMKTYAMIACPTLYAGQTITAQINCDVDARVRLFVSVYGADDQLVQAPGNWVAVRANENHILSWTLQTDGGSPIAQVGLQIESAQPGTLKLDYLTWGGAPNVCLGKPPHNGTRWQRAWVKVCDDAIFARDYALRACQEESNGLLIQGEREWSDYSARAKIIPHLARSAGIAVCVQGRERYYALTLCDDGYARLVKMRDGRRVLAEEKFAWLLDCAYDFELTTCGAHLVGAIDGCVLFAIDDTTMPLQSGAVALVIEAGRLDCDAIQISPSGQDRI